jgi:CheY-like chemotaxis protein
VPPVRGDRDRLAQALDNLVSNAIKFTPDGGRVTVRLAREEDRAVIEVSDTGIGISETDAPAVAVLDGSKPRVDGLEATRRLRDRPETRAIPIMLLTARVTDADRERARDAEADAQLDKPFSPAVLAERVRALLADRDG